MDEEQSIGSNVPTPSSIRHSTFIGPGSASVIFWAGIISFSLATSLAPGFFHDHKIFGIAVKSSVKALAGVWVMADALSRGWSQRRSAQYLAVSIVIPEIGAPVYLVKSRGWRGAAKSALKFVGYGIVVGTLISVMLKALHMASLGATA